jgi:UDP-N-acetylglucosamine 2-epimerase
MLVIGARPQFVKSAPLIKEMAKSYKRIHLTIVHSGQHYDPDMSAIFFRELKIPKPSMNLRAGSGSHAEQTAVIMKRLESTMLDIRPNLVVVAGDTNTTLAGALVAAKLRIKVAHVEAGMRSGDVTMPEEINRKLTDHCASMLFAPTRTAMRNLREEGLGKQAYLTGDTMVDTLREAMRIVEGRQHGVLARRGLRQGEYVLVTLHRPSNVDDARRLTEIQLALRELSTRLEVVFPVHPRTRLNLSRLGLLGPLRRSSVTLIPPQGYIPTLALLKNAGCLLTDSGGMQKESFIMHVPCITLRSTTEWPETLTGKANRLLGDPKMIPEVVLATASDYKLRNRIMHLRNPFGDGRACTRITQLIQEKIPGK